MKELKILISKVLTIFIIFTINCNLAYAEDFTITSNEAVLYNLNDNKIIYELNKDERVPVASLTKIMTTIIALENIDNLDEEVTITAEAFLGTDGYSKAGFKIGNKVTYRDLLYGIILPSGADAVNAIVLNTTGNLDEFVSLMNKKAEELNLVNTHFDNAIGMDSDPTEVMDSNDENVNIASYGNYSTAQDIAILLKYALENATFKEIFTTKEYTVPNTNLKLKSTLTTYATYSNLDTSNILGAKSGFTDDAGLCLASISTIDNVNYLLVTLGASTTNRANAVKDSLTIYNYYSNNYSYKTVLDTNQIIDTIPIKWGKEKEYNIKSETNLELYLKNDIDLNKIKYNYQGIEELNYKILSGSKLGTVEVIYEEEVLTTLDIYLKEKLDYYHPSLYAIILLTLILIISIIISKKKRRKRRRRKRK